MGSISFVGHALGNTSNIALLQWEKVLEERMRGSRPLGSPQTSPHVPAT